MVLSLARQSVIIKCQMKASIITGNYEFYYAAGVLYKLNGKVEEKVPEPPELMDRVQKLIAEYSTEDEQEKYLIRMLSLYRLEEPFDEQMVELFNMGLKERYMWQEMLPQS